MQEISISTYFLRAVLKHAPAHGINVQKILFRANISPQIVAKHGARVTAKQFAALQTLTMREMDDELLGYSKQSVKVGCWSAMCHWLVHARTLAQALKRFCYFYSSMERGLKPELLIRGNCVYVFFKPWREEALEPYAYELMMFCLHRFTSWLVDETLPIKEVTLSYPKPDHAQEYSALFPRAECTFDQPHCALIFDREMLGKPVKKTADILATYLRQAALNIVISDYNHQSWTAKTRRVLRGQMANIQSLDDVAKQFDMHAKTLRRLLKSEGVRYSELKSQLRRDVAIGRLTGTNESIEQIAFAVGFSESCTFIRAFKAWTGVTPSAYRKLGRANLT